MNSVGSFQLRIFCDSMRLLQGTGKGTGKISCPVCLFLCSCCAEKKSQRWVLSWCRLLLHISGCSVWADVTCLISKVSAASAVTSANA